VEKTKRERADSLRNTGWSNPFEVLSGAVETTGAALKKNAVINSVSTGVKAGADVTVQTGRLLVKGVESSSRAVSGVATGVAEGVVGAGKTLVVKPVGKVVSTTGTLVSTGVSTTGKVIGSTGRAVGTVVSSTGRALANIVNPTSAQSRQRTPSRTSPMMPLTLQKDVPAA